MDPDVGAFDPRWAVQFAAERSALSELLATVLVTEIEHIGSTSVPGLSAKPIIDMIAGVSSLDAIASIHEVLASCGYQYRRHRPEAQLFIRIDPDNGLDTHHLHLTTPGSDLWVERLTFRDALRHDPDLVERYAAWKQEHATGDPNRAYDTVKTPFVAAVLAMHGVELKSDRHAL